jgi:hypothetical protein
LLNTSDRLFNMPELVFDPFDAATIRSPHGLYARLRDEAPVHFQPFDRIRGGAGADADAAGDRGFTRLRFADVFSRADVLVGQGSRSTGATGRPSGSSHHRDDGSAGPHGLPPPGNEGSPQAVAPLEPMIRRFVRQRLDVLADRMRPTATPTSSRCSPTFAQLRRRPLPQGARGRPVRRLDVAIVSRTPVAT